MAYNSRSIPIDALISASLKAGALGALSFTAVLVQGFVLPSLTSSANAIEAIKIAGFAFLFSFFLGSLTIALCLALFGLPLAHFAERILSSGAGAIYALISAILVAALVCAFLFGLGAILFVLPFAIPAGIFFRSEILLHRDLG